MESACVYEQKAVIHELTQGIQMAKKLRVNLNSVEPRQFLIHKILTSYENALYALKLGDSATARHPQSTALPTPSMLQSSISTESPGSEEFGFDQPVSGHQGQNIISKKRKGCTISEDQVGKCTDNGLEVDTGDGYYWRKYGQKNILGAKFPRSYYRCAYRNAQNCLATKQVQRTDKDSTAYEIAYQGMHTCNYGTQLTAPSQLPPPEKHETEPTHHHNQQLSPPNPTEMLSNLRANLSFDTSDFGDATIPSSFSFPSTSFEFMEDCQQLQFQSHFDAELLQVYSPSYISPNTPESNYFTDWGSSPSLDFPADPTVVDPDFEFDYSFF